MCSHCKRRPVEFRVYGPSVSEVCKVCYSFLVHTANIMGFSLEVERVSQGHYASVW